jgi:ankyrin repeat protein
VKLLLEKGAHVESKNSSSQTSLSLVANDGHEAIVKQLLAKNGVGLNSKDNNS